MARPRFNPSADFVAARSFLYAGVQYKAGDPFDKSGIAAHKLNTLYGSRAINQAEAGADPIKMREVSPGRYEITAPWLDEPVKAHGKGKAEAALAELREAGEPLDHHGVAIVEGENGFYSVTMEWDDENAYNVEGFDGAYALATKLRAEGPPPPHYALVEVLPVEGEDDLFDVRAPWLAGIERITGSEAAQARAQEIRVAGPPEEFDPEAQPLYEVEAERIAAEERKAAFDALVAIETVTEGEGDDAKTSYVLTSPGLDEPETFETEADAQARQTELREAGPPEGWQAPEAPAPTE